MKAELVVGKWLRSGLLSHIYSDFIKVSENYFWELTKKTKNAKPSDKYFISRLHRIAQRYKLKYKIVNYILIRINLSFGTQGKDDHNELL